jgi:hypothetical protein
MPRFCISTRVITFEYEQIIEAPNEQTARDIAYAAIEIEIPPDGYAEQHVTLMTSETEK